LRHGTLILRAVGEELAAILATAPGKAGAFGTAQGAARTRKIFSNNSSSRTLRDSSA
jgi:hypothetical protein